MSETGKKYLKATGVCSRYRIGSLMTLYRWLNDEELGFPQPVVIRGVRFFSEGELDAFDESRKRMKISNPFREGSASRSSGGGTR